MRPELKVIKKGFFFRLEHLGHPEFTKERVLADFKRQRDSVRVNNLLKVAP